MAKSQPAWPPYPPFAAFPANAPFPPFPPYPPFPAAPAPCARHATPGATSGATSGAAPGLAPGSGPGPAPGPAPSPPGLTGTRSPFPVTRIALAPNPAGLHQGTGTHQRSVGVVQAASVAGSGPLQFAVVNAQVTTLLFQLATPSAPNWFAVAVPAGVTDFTRAHLFFHPIPGQGGYLDSEYVHKGDPTYVYSGTPWPNLFYLIERLGFQSAASARPTVVVVPFLTSGATQTGILAPDWASILSDLLTDARTAVGVAASTSVDVAELTVSSHSVGIVYSAAFRAKAAGLGGVLRYVWDFDGRASSASALSDSLVSTSTVRAVKYDQGGGVASFAVALARWAALPVPVSFPPYASHSDTHHLIRDFMAVHAATVV